MFSGGNIMNHYLFRFTIHCDGYEFTDKFCVTGGCKKTAQKKAHKFLLEYYGDIAEYNEKEKSYTYNAGDIVIQNIHCTEISENIAQIISLYQL